MKFLILSLMTVLALSSCAATKYIAKTDFNSISDVAIVSPVTSIEFLDKKGNSSYDDSLSAECARLITEALGRSPLPTGSFVDIDFDSTGAACREAVASFRNIQPKKAGETPVPHALDSLLEVNGKRYGIFVLAEGFTRDRGNYGKAVAMGLGLALVTTVATMGMATAYSVPYKSATQVWMTVVDSENDKIVFYNSQSREDSEPAKEKHIDALISRMLKDFRK